MTRDQAIERIKKCMALSSSSNEHEASAALRQAQALMRKHGIGAADVDASYVSESSAKAGAGARIPTHLCVLGKVVGDAFACHPIVVHVSGISGGEMRFFGVDPKPEIAAYVFTVLRRKLERNRTAYVATLKRCKRATKIRRGKLFAEAWAVAVAGQVKEFAGNEQDRERIQAYNAKQNRNLSETGGRRAKPPRQHDHSAQSAGFYDGRKASIHGAVNAPDDSRRLGQS